jgi:hypothetical protein
MALSMPIFILDSMRALRLTKHSQQCNTMPGERVHTRQCLSQPRSRSNDVSEMERGRCLH